MNDEKPKPATRHRVGDLITVKPAGVVTGPDGTTHVVIRGAFYLDQVGTFIVDGTKVVVE
ncbi:hypothetical protein [Nocardioides sp.]|uniref:hypothetical protein n=1 Tax=Nocardioides sp. TaxID=35761 RepID=UPI002B26F783|nr:hypothetical protein [Nocardioides sp.]